MPFEKRWLVSVITCLIPSGASERLPEGAADLPLERFIDDLLAHAPLKFLLGLRACLWVVSLAPCVVLGRLRLFHQLGDEEQLQLLTRFKDSDAYLVREMPLLFKMVGCLAYGGHPRIQARLALEPRDETPPDWARTASQRAPETPGGDS